MPRIQPALWADFPGTGYLRYVDFVHLQYLESFYVDVLPETASNFLLRLLCELWRREVAGLA